MNHELPSNVKPKIALNSAQEVNLNTNDARDLRRICFIYVSTGLALSAVFIANKEFDKAAVCLSLTAAAALGLRIRE